MSVKHAPKEREGDRGFTYPWSLANFFPYQSGPDVLKKKTCMHIHAMCLERASNPLLCVQRSTTHSANGSSSLKPERFGHKDLTDGCLRLNRRDLENSLLLH